MSYGFELSGDTGILTVTGNLTIEDAAELKTAIADALETAHHIVFDLSGLASADLCCLQLFCSAHRTAVRTDKTLVLDNAGDGFMGSLQDAGYGRHVGCIPGDGQNCLWIEDSGKKTEVAV